MQFKYLHFVRFLKASKGGREEESCSTFKEKFQFRCCLALVDSVSSSFKKENRHMFFHVSNFGEQKKKPK